MKKDMMPHIALPRRFVVTLLLSLSVIASNADAETQAVRIDCSPNDEALDVSAFIASHHSVAFVRPTIYQVTQESGQTLPPDEHGVMLTTRLDLPPITRATYYVSEWWPGGGNRCYPFVVGPGDALDDPVETFGDLPEGGIFCVAEMRSGRYLAMVPMATDRCYSWLFTDNEGRLSLKTGTHGTAPLSGDVPRLAMAVGLNPYWACEGAWSLAMEESGHSTARADKTLSEPLKHLGWCSWEHYHKNIDEASMLDALAKLEASDLPIRYMLIDDGHFERKSLMPDARRFPNGYQPLTARRTNEGVRWIGLWYAFLGDNHGVKAPGVLDPIAEHLYESPLGVMMPRPDRASQREFFEYLIHPAVEADIDFLKVDFMVDALPVYAGLRNGNPTTADVPPDNRRATANPYQAAATMMRVFQQVAAEGTGNAVINCNWHNAACLFSSGMNPVGRCSEDYKVGDLDRARQHLYHSYSAMPWLGQIAWGDHDMFHSMDPFAGRMMAISKAMSGGPVYLSDEPSQFNDDVIWPLVDSDGRLYRPLAPATPVGDDIFYAPGQGRLYRVVAPLANGAAAMVVYNLDGGVGDDEEELVTTIDTAHYLDATGLLPPGLYGAWIDSLPTDFEECEFLVYDHADHKATELGFGYEVRIRGFGDRLLQFMPIRHDWAVIGNPEKYLSGATFELTEVTAESVTIETHEAGPILVWHASDTMLFADRAEGQRIAKGLFLFDLPAGEAVIRRGR